MLIKRYAKLSTSVESNAQEFKIFAYDDQAGGDEAVAWLYCEIRKDIKVLELTSLDFEATYNSQVGRNKATSVLMNEFLKLYGSKYGKNSNIGWFDVIIDFPNPKIDKKLEELRAEGVLPLETQAPEVSTESLESPESPESPESSEPVESVETQESPESQDMPEATQQAETEAVAALRMRIRQGRRV